MAGSGNLPIDQMAGTTAKVNSMLPTLLSAYDSLRTQRRFGSTIALGRYVISDLRTGTLFVSLHAAPELKADDTKFQGLHDDLTPLCSGHSRVWRATCSSVN